MVDINEKIELLEEQISNYERSGFFTELEINKFTAPLYMELETLKKTKAITADDIINSQKILRSSTGLTLDSIKKSLNEIVVNDPILVSDTSKTN